MSELISGKEAFIAALSGYGVTWRHVDGEWVDWTKHTAWCIDALTSSSYQFKLKPKTILLNGIELPAPFKPKVGETYYTLCPFAACGYDKYTHVDIDSDKYACSFGSWKLEEDIKQVVAVLHNIFNNDSK